MSLCSIMIIDDNHDDRFLLKRQIQRANLTDKIFEANDGVTALEFLQDCEENSLKNPNEYPPMLIFLDINMPIMGGFEFLEKFEKMRENLGAYKSSVLTMFSSSEREEEKQKALAYEFVKGYIVKMPSTPDDLREIVKGHFPEISFT